MSLKLFVCIATLLTAVAAVQAQDLSSIEQNRVKLPNGWSLTPVGKTLPLGDLPLNIAVSRSHRYAAVTNDGQSTQSIQLLDAKNDQQLDRVVIGKAWGGLVFSADEKYLYASGGDNNWVVRYSIIDNKLVASDTLPLGEPWIRKTNANAISPAGMALDDKKDLLYVVTKQDNSLYVLDLKTKAIRHKLALGTEAYTCLLSADASRLYISLWGGDKVVTYDTNKERMIDSVAVGDNPNDLCLSHNGKVLYVANANDNTVSVIDLKHSRVLETLNTAVIPTPLSGTTTNSVALTGDDKTLYVANADNNCLAVFDVRKPGASKSLGFVPTGWYPSVVRVIDSKLYVADAKGLSSLPNPHGPNPTGYKETVLFHGGDPNKPRDVQYIGGGLLMGALSIIPIPGTQDLAVYSQAVYHNTPYNEKLGREPGGEAGNPVPGKAGDPSPIKYVFYILQENRTYDQVLSDMPGGNGDTSLLLFGRRITPNHHALADDFVLLDNFYVDGEVSADGHNWSMGAYATDYMEKNWPTSYGGRGHFTPEYPVHDLRDPDTMRYRIWAKDFDSLLATGAAPRLTTMRMLSDHTEGTAAGRPTPYAHVADNDLAVGKLVEHISKSPIWANTVIFIVEDDAQNGPDHVDAHRTTAYLAGGYVKRHFVDHTLYSTSSLVHTIELILGMPPMTQYDAAAPPMWNCFSKTTDTTAFNSLPSNVNLADVNPGGTRLAAMARGLNFTEVDRVPDELMNAMVWKAVRGENARVPVPVRAAFVRTTKTSEDGD